MHMRRVLIVVTLTVLLIVSIGIGVLVADWPRWRQMIGQAPAPAAGSGVLGEVLRQHLAPGLPVVVPVAPP